MVDVFHSYHTESNQMGRQFVHLGNRCFGYCHSVGASTHAAHLFSSKHTPASLHRTLLGWGGHFVLVYKLSAAELTAVSFNSLLVLINDLFNIIIITADDDLDQPVVN